MATTMMKTTVALAVTLALTGCGTMGNNLREMANAGPQDPSVVKTEFKKAIEVPAPASGAMTVAVYSFRDLTGQRKNQNNIASLSSAVTQGADAYLIRSLQTVGDGRWFKVVERGGLDNIVKERQLIRQMRELYEGKDAKPLPPMVFAGMLLEGGIIGYDSNTMSGGSGARILGIGAQTEYRQDEVVVSMRAVSVATGEVLVSVTVAKTVISFQDKLGVLRFNELGTKSVEMETGSATNESMNKAVQLAVHGAVIELIFEGERKGHWQFKKPAPKVEAPKVELKVETKETKNELVKENITVDETKQKESVDSKSTNSDLGSRDNEQPTTVEKTPARTEIPDQPKQKLQSVKLDTFLSETEASKSAIVAVVKKGTEIEVLETKGQVARVSLKGEKNSLQGWMLLEYIEQ